MAYTQVAAEEVHRIRLLLNILIVPLHVFEVMNVRLILCGRCFG